MLPYSDNMTFAERWYNTLVGFYDWFIRNLFYLPNEKNFAKKHFAHLAPLPPLEELINNVSLTMVNSHRAITPPRPSMPSNSNRNIPHTQIVTPMGKPISHIFFSSNFSRYHFDWWRSYQSTQTITAGDKSISGWCRAWSHLF